MKTQKIDIKAENEAVRHLYETAFPEEEQIPWEDLMRFVNEIPLDFTLYYDDEDEFLSSVRSTVGVQSGYGRSHVWSQV